MSAIVFLFFIVFFGAVFFTQKATDTIVHGDRFSAVSLVKEVFWFVIAVFFVSFLLFIVAIIFEVLEWRCSVKYMI